MKKLSIACCFTIFLSLPALAQIPDSVMMRNWMEYMTPGKEHAMLASWDGNWTGSVKMWMAPGAPPTTATLATKNSMIMGGRYQQSTHKGDMMGMPFEGFSLVGFDNEKKSFISIWVDNMGTGVMKSEGTWNDKDRAITFKGMMMDPAQRKEQPFREVFRVIDNNTQVMEMYGPGPDGKEFKTMEIRFTRNQ